MTETGEYFQTIGRLMAERLGDHPHPDEVFAPIATEVLQAVPRPPIDVLAMADWAAGQHPLPKQVNAASKFGQPPLVVFEAPGFYIEVLFWFPSRTRIHGHGFTGAFVVLDGYSVQVEYRFEEASAPEEGIRLGRLVPHGIEMIAPGRICPILREDDFIHTVAHMGNPSLTLVARTHGGGRDLRQFTYYLSGFAYRAHYRQQSVARQLDVLEALHKARPQAFAACLIRLLEASDMATFVKVLGQLPSRLTLPVFSKVAWPVVRERFGATHGPALAAVEEVVRHDGLWTMVPALKEPRRQLLLALSELFPDQAVRDALICRSYGVSDAGPILEDWLRVAEQAAAPPAV